MTYAEANRWARWLNSAPEVLYIDGLPWIIRFTKERIFVPNTEDEAWGLCHSGKHVIEVSMVNRSSLRHVTETFIHEVLHAVWTSRRLPDKPKEEDAVQNISAGLVSLFIANPALLPFIQKGLK